MEVLFLIAGLLVGAAIAYVAAYVIVSGRAKADLANQSAQMQAQSASQLSQLQARAATAEGVVVELRTQIGKAVTDAQTLQRELDHERNARVQAQTQMAEAVKNINEQKAMLDSAQARLSETFKALSSDALKSNNQAFLELAGKSFDAVIAEARGDIGKKQQAIDSLIKPLAGSLERYEQQIKAMEQIRASAYGEIQEQIKTMTASQQQLQKETGNLVTALRTPQVRGRWGEMTLRRVVELAGMSEHCDYAEQVTVDSEEGKLRPDMVIHLHGDRRIVVDSKVSLEAYLKAISAETEEDRNRHLAQHAAQIRTHMQQLAGKQYWSQFEHTPELVVMFIPGESFFAAALDCDQSLLESGMQKRVVLATPTTLITLLWAVALGWRQDQMAENAKAISDLGRDLFERIKVLSSHIVRVGTSLKQAVDSHNKAVGSMESRVLPSVRKFQELGAAGGEGIDIIEPLDVAIRPMNTEDTGPADET